MTDDEALKE